MTAIAIAVTWRFLFRFILFLLAFPFFVPLVIFTLSQSFYSFNLCVVYSKYRREWQNNVVNVKFSFRLSTKFDIISIIHYNEDYQTEQKHDFCSVYM